MVHGADGTRGAERVHQGMVPDPCAGQGAAAGPGGRLCIQHERGLRSGRDPEQEDRRLSGKHEGRLPDGGIPALQGSAGRAPPGLSALRQRGSGRRPARHLQQRDRLHHARLSLRGDREDRRSPVGKQKAEPVHQMQPHPGGLPLRPQVAGCAGL